MYRFNRAIEHVWEKRKTIAKVALNIKAATKHSLAKRVLRATRFLLSIYFPHKPRLARKSPGKR